MSRRTASESIPCGLPNPEPLSLIRIMPDEPNQPQAIVHKCGAYELAMVEFDDQGRCYNRNQVQCVKRWFDAHAEEDVIIVVFVHGWKHNARSDDDNLAHFVRVLTETTQHEQQLSEKAAAQPRPVLGVFVGWRGASLYDRFDLIQNLTFWDCQDVARKVAVGSVRELLGALRRYRQERLAKEGAPLLVVAGHSFGGIIVYSALAQSLIEAAGDVSPVPNNRFADLVLLVNPAFEAVRYLPMLDQLKEQSIPTTSSPQFVSITARNDWATGIAFRFGNAYCRITQSARNTEERETKLWGMSTG